VSLPGAQEERSRRQYAPSPICPRLNTSNTSATSTRTGCGSLATRNAAATANIEGLPAVLPAVGLYRQLLAIGLRQTGQPIVDDKTASDLAAWLTADNVVQHAARLLVSGHRIPQEALNLTALHQDRNWRQDL
jgi:hypothetical protein